MKRSAKIGAPKARKIHRAKANYVYSQLISWSWSYLERKQPTNKPIYELSISPERIALIVTSYKYFINIFVIAQVQLEAIYSEQLRPIYLGHVHYQSQAIY